MGCAKNMISKFLTNVASKVVCTQPIATLFIEVFMKNPKSIIYFYLIILVFLFITMLQLRG